MSEDGKGCLFADVVDGCHGESSEHIVPECLGGGEEQTGVICGVCNQYFGNTLDKELCTPLEPALVSLATAMRARYRAKHMHVESVDGSVRYCINPGGVVDLAGIQRLYNADGSVRAVIGPDGTVE